MNVVRSLLRMAVRVRGAFAWRLHKLLGDKVVYGALLRLTGIWRAVLRRPVFVGITGSAGKTTAKELMLGMLAHKGGGVGNPGSFNNIEEVAMAMLRLRPWHRFFVTELSEDRPGVMDCLVALMRPSVGIVTVVRDDHLAAFESREGLAQEMEKLVLSLPTSGTAVLNADDERVLAMAAVCKAKVLTYGISARADLRAENVSSAWPERLSMTVVRGDERVEVQTQLCGTHWVPSVLGAIGGALASGMTLQECAIAIATVVPFEGRMQPVTTPEGVTFIRDDFKAPLWTLGACFNFVNEASARRKIIVIGELSEVESQKAKKYARSAVLAQQVADVTIYVGPWASSVLRARDPAKEDSLYVFSHVHDAAEYLNSITGDGDLVLLKGSVKQDHLQRIILARTNAIACWRDDCQRNMYCSACPNQRVPTGLPTSKENIPNLSTAITQTTHRPVALDATEQVIIGLGNPGEQFNNTPHNVGYEAVDQVSSVLGLAWTEGALAWMARGELNGKAICLIKIAAPMNLIGDSLRQLSAEMGFRPDQCILIFDDLDLPIGTFKTRQRGSAGGHKGVASILEAFQSDEFRRIKIGIGQAEYKTNRTQYVLTPFVEGDQSIVNAAIEKVVISVRSTLGRGAE